MTTTTYIISLSKTNHRIVRTDDERDQTTTPLAKDIITRLRAAEAAIAAPAHTAFERGTSDRAIRSLSQHPAGRSWRTLEALADDCCLSPDEVAEAVSNGKSI